MKLNLAINKNYLNKTIKNTSGFVLLLLLIALLAGVPEDVTAQTKSAKKSAVSADKKDIGDFLPVYSKIKNENYKDFDQLMREQKILEDIASDLNKTLALPTDVTITLRDCGEPNAFYNPNDKSITVCYEFMELFYDRFVQMGYNQQEAQAMMFGATIFFFFHELGHCLIDIYDLPAVGREEDAVDQLSTAILMEDLSDEGTVSALAGLLIFRSLSENETPTQHTFADEHSLNSQRFFNLACWMYGRSPQGFKMFTEDGVLPEARAVRCQEEYQKLSKSWTQLIQPWTK